MERGRAGDKWVLRREAAWVQVRRRCRRGAAARLPGAGRPELAAVPRARRPGLLVHPAALAPCPDWLGVLLSIERRQEGGHVIRRRLEQYPFPIAYPARLLAIAEEPADRLEKASQFVELTAATLGVVALGWCRANSLAADVLDKWEQRLDPFGITLGTWNDVIRSASKAMAGRPGDPLAKALRLSGDAVLGALETYQPTRNVYAHGGKPPVAAGSARGRQ